MDTAPAPATEDLRFTHIFDSPLETVWRAWTDADILAKWWGPDKFTCPYASMDVRTGGMSIVAMHGPPEWGLPVSYGCWAYEDVVPLKRFAYIHNFCDRDGHRIEPTTIGMPADFPRDLRMEFDFKALEDGKTELTILEHDWPLGHMRDQSKKGMEQTLAKLDTLLRSGASS
jgi:uncharacterized protein YndB with AHSA1/START domain